MYIGIALKVLISRTVMLPYDTNMQISLDSVDCKFLKSWLPDQDCGP